MRTALSLGQAWSSPAKKPGVRPALFYAVSTLLLATNVVMGVVLLMSGDISKLLNGQNEVVLSAYEDRIAQLRLEVDRLHSRHYAQAGDLNLQFQELAQQQDLLTEQHQFVRALADKASELGITAAALDEAETGTKEVASLALKPPSTDVGLTVASETLAVQTMIDDSRLALAAISRAATRSTDAIIDELGAIGIQPSLPDAGDAVGGPLLPALEGSDSLDLVDDANAVMSALIRLKAARVAIDEAPVHKPLAGERRMSSRFGNRRDPFTRGSAFHAGLDFAAPTGTTVLSAGGGKVSFVGQKSGYGNVVEITHAAGMVTRYAHLSAFLVREGQSVNTGTPIAKVGSTGRSTGPHLHFEVRRQDKAIDPAKFLAVGTRLQRFLAAG